MKVLSLIGILATVVLLVRCGNWVNAQDHRSIEEEEQQVLSQFFNYVDVVSNIKYENMLDMSRNFVEFLLGSIPDQDRGNTAEMLQRFINDAQYAKRGSLDQKESTIKSLGDVINTIKQELVKHEQEDLIVRNKLPAVINLLAALAIEERRDDEKFARAISVLRSKFTTAGMQRHAALFGVLDAIEQEQDIVREEQLMNEFKTIRKDYKERGI